MSAIALEGFLASPARPRWQEESLGHSQAEQDPAVQCHLVTTAEISDRSASSCLPSMRNQHLGKHSLAEAEIHDQIWPTESRKTDFSNAQNITKTVIKRVHDCSSPKHLCRCPQPIPCAPCLPLPHTARTSSCRLEHTSAFHAAPQGFARAANTHTSFSEGACCGQQPEPHRAPRPDRSAAPASPSRMTQERAALCSSLHSDSGLLNAPAFRSQPRSTSMKSNDLTSLHHFATPLP